MVAITVDAVTKRFGGAAVLRDISLLAPDGELVVILGPSGSGKSSLLRIVAGLEKPDSGRVMFDGEDVTPREPSNRNVAMVFQDNALYPFMTVRRNVAFPLEVAHTDRDEIDRRVTAESRVLAIEQLLDRMPPQLSAGHQQLVQAARAMVRVPAVFLMDEPLARLDSHYRTLMRQELRLLQQGYGVTTLYATNDQAEGLAIADRVAVLRAGELQQVGSPRDVYRRPVNVFVAGFVGLPSMNIVPGVVRSGEGGGFDVSVLGGRHRVWTEALAPFVGRSVLVGMRPEHLTVAKGGDAEIVSVEDHGDRRFVRVGAPGRIEVTVRDEDGDVQLGDRVRFEIGEAHVFHPETEVAIHHPL